MSDSDSDAFAALENKFANDGDIDQLERPNISLLPLQLQLQQKSKVEAEENIDHKIEQREPTSENEDVLMENIANDFNVPLEMTEMEKSNIHLEPPWRKTIFPECSGLLFSEGVDNCIEKMVIGKSYSENFKSILCSHLVQNFDKLNVSSIISECAKISSEEWHCVAKGLMFVMSIAQDEKLVDVIFDTLLQFSDSYMLTLEDFLQVFVNWGIPKSLLQPPFVMDNDVLQFNPQDCHLNIKDYNIFKTLDFFNKLFYNKKVELNLKSRMIFVRALLMMWLDKRFTVSLDSPKFKTYVTSFVDTFDTSVENVDVICQILDLSGENNHNQCWIITRLLEGETPKVKEIGFLMASQFLLRMFNQKTTPYQQLNLHQLHSLLESDVLEVHNIYSVHVILVVVDAYLMSYDTTWDDKNVIMSIVKWSYNMEIGYKCASLNNVDKQTILMQLRNIILKLRTLVHSLKKRQPFDESIWRMI